MQGGWGALGGGAWGGAPAQGAVEDEESPKHPSAPPAPPLPSSFKPNPVAAPVPSPKLPGGVSTRVQDNGPSSPFPPTEAALRKREKELDERERRLEARERELGTSGKPKNWPICSPFMRHSIAEDIPEHSRRVVREAYMCWWGLIIALTWQFFCATVMLGYGVDNKVPSWFLSIIFWVAGVPLSLWLWYIRIYNAAKDDSTMGFVAFFFFFFCHWAFCVFCAIGIQVNAAQWCFSGFMAGISAFDTNTFAGIIYMVGGGVWSVLALYSMWVLKDAWFFFRGQGGVRQVAEKRKQDQALASFAQGLNGSSNANNRV